MTKIEIVQAENYQGEDLERLKQAIQLLENTINSDEFKKAVIDFKTHIDGGTFHFIRKEKKGLRIRTFKLKRYTNTEVLEKILKGNSQFKNKIELKLKMEFGDDGDVVGYKKSGSSTIHTYEKFVKNMTLTRFAAHIIHEYCHIIGFEHSSSSKHDKLRDCYSVPYAIHKMLKKILLGSNASSCQYLHMK
ncbi:hypothetical protein [Aquiflexum lacus]|uniref:hypothetical protein n=1 Tax=Aquiflexum lacus TaxID=2483805 RepID=UPI001894B8B3|nr:hypothetical protein [Aquiflexum lacus]